MASRHPTYNKALVKWYRTIFSRFRRSISIKLVRSESGESVISWKTPGPNDLLQPINKCTAVPVATTYWFFGRAVHVGSNFDFVGVILNHSFHAFCEQLYCTRVGLHIQPNQSRTYRRELFTSCATSWTPTVAISIHQINNIPKFSRFRGSVGIWEY